MKIAVVPPLVAPITDRDAPLGGAQTFVVDLARGLHERGHAVVLLGADGSHVNSIEAPRLGIDAALLQPARFDDGAARTDLDAQREAFERVRSWLAARGRAIDIVHAHAFDAPAFEVLAGLRQPVCHTLHLPPIDPIVVAAARAAPAHLVTVSEANAAAWRAAGVPVAAVVPNGIDVESVPAPAQSGGYLLFAGRISPEKGPDRAIEAARALGLPLLLVGGSYDTAFAARDVLPHVASRPAWRLGKPLGGGATYIGARPRAELFQLMAGAAALLLPVRWAEPFGLVAIEAQAAGCPVIAYARGGLPEVIADGRTGYVVAPDDAAAFAGAVRRAIDLDRGDCRAWIAERFSRAAMAARYEKVFQHMLTTPGHALLEEEA